MHLASNYATITSCPEDICFANCIRFACASNCYVSRFDLKTVDGMAFGFDGSKCEGIHVYCFGFVGVKLN